MQLDQTFLKLLMNIMKNMKKKSAVIPILQIQDAIKQKYGKYIYGKDKYLFVTQTPQAFKTSEFLNYIKKIKNILMMIFLYWI